MGRINLVITKSNNKRRSENMEEREEDQGRNLLIFSEILYER
jgi:hypothetical protein